MEIRAQKFLRSIISYLSQIKDPETSSQAILQLNVPVMQVTVHLNEKVPYYVYDNLSIYTCGLKHTATILFIIIVMRLF